MLTYAYASIRMRWYGPQQEAERSSESACALAHFTCFTTATVQILTRKVPAEALLVCALRGGRVTRAKFAQVYCFDLLCEQKSTNTDS
jgi:hypothetical protein